MVPSARALLNSAGDRTKPVFLHGFAANRRASQLSFEKERDHVENITKICGSLKGNLWNDLLSVVQSQLDTIAGAHQSFRACANGKLYRFESCLTYTEDGVTEALRATFETNVKLRRDGNQPLERRTLDNNVMDLRFTCVSIRFLILDAPPPSAKERSQKDQETSRLQSPVRKKSSHRTKKAG